MISAPKGALGVPIDVKYRQNYRIAFPLSVLFFFILFYGGGGYSILKTGRRGRLMAPARIYAIDDKLHSP